MKRHPPTHALTAPPSTPHHHEQASTVASNIGGGSGAFQQAQAGHPIAPPPRLPPCPTAKPTPPPFPPCWGASRHKRVPTQAGCAPTHPLPASPPGARCGGAPRIPAAGLRGADHRSRPCGGGCKDCCSWCPLPAASQDDIVDLQQLIVSL